MCARMIEIPSDRERRNPDGLVNNPVSSVGVEIARMYQELRLEFESEREKRMARLEALLAEIDRVTKNLNVISEEIAVMIEDPDVELSRVMRKKTEQSELQAYLSGLRFFLG